MMPWEEPCACDPHIDELVNGYGELLAVPSSHEHSDFEPHACVHCDCNGHRPPRTPTRDVTQPEARSHLTIPADATDFAALRVTETAQWVDQILTGLHETRPTHPDDPIPVCMLADMLEQTWPKHLDPLDALAITVRRLIAKPAPIQRVLNTIRRTGHR